MPPARQHILVVTPASVKAHVINHYRKPGANNRRAAVKLAREPGLLATDQTSSPLLG